MTDRLNPNDDLAVIGSITSQNGQSTLVMQGDGNLVLYRAGGRARWATGTDGRQVSQAVMQGDGNFVMYGPGGIYIWDTATDGHPGAWLVVQDDGNVVIYDPAGNPLWASDTMIVIRSVPGFLPSTSGFHFPNSFPPVPHLTIDVAGQKLPIGDASQGLCGGMVFAVRDYFDAGISIPPDTTSPSSGPLFDYIVKRLYDSFNLLLPLPPLPPVPGLFITPTPPWGPGPFTYLHLMNPDVPDHETVASKIGLSYRGRAWIMINDECPKIRADIDSGQLSPIALVEVKDHDPMQMGNNHQVLVYGYSLDGTDLTMRLYDPNEPNNDTVTMSLSLADPEHTTEVRNSVVSPVWCFFRPIYTFSAPPPPPLPPPAVGIGDHFYTTSAVERDTAIAIYGYSSEGTASHVFDTQIPGTVPLYRLLHSSNGDHFYTASAAERDGAIATYGYIPEGIACYVFDAQAPGTVPLFRLLHSSNGDHFYTTSEQECADAIDIYGYIPEGIACYVFDPQAPGTVPLYRLLKTS